MWAYPEIRFLGDAVTYYARRSPDKLAFSFEGKHFDFGKVELETNKIANALLGQGIKIQDRVVFFGKKLSGFFSRVVRHGKIRRLFSPPQLAPGSA